MGDIAPKMAELTDGDDRCSLLLSPHGTNRALQVFDKRASHHPPTRYLKILLVLVISTMSSKGDGTAWFDARWMLSA